MILSFVIPVYNTGKYLERCFNSIINQGICNDDIEIIIINDGSTDDSAAIIKGYQYRYDCIKTVHTENHGLGAARNIGINLSKGKYIFFVDSDDYILDGSLNPLIEYARRSTVDIIGFNWQIIYPNGDSRKQKNSKINYNSIVPGAEYLSNYNLKAGVCFYLYKGSFLRDTPILMPEGIYHEDELFLPRAFIYAKKIIFTDQTVYAYCQRKDSITNKKDFDFLQKRIDDNFYVLDQLMSLSVDKNLNKRQQQGLEHKIIFFTVDFIVNLFRFQVDNNLLKQVIEKLKERGQYPLPKKSYGWKYAFFRAFFNSEQNIALILKTGLLKKR